MLAAVERFGLDDAVQRFDGMFAFALWDRRERALTLVRDRLGIKPLYYGHVGSDFVFGSELKALKEHPDWDADIDRDALCLYFRHNYIPAPYTVYSGIRKLEPGHMLTVREDGVGHDRQYWSAAAVWAQGLAKPFSGSENEAEEQLDALLGHAVKRHMIADVPLGAFLSGGIDSSTVAAFMQTQSMAKVKTFSIGFPDQAYDEAPAAARVAAHLGTEHTQLYADVLSVATDSSACDGLPVRGRRRRAVSWLHPLFLCPTMLELP
jgi:asparagine synthase (glutamine-hydrolysing)